MLLELACTLATAFFAPVQNAQPPKTQIIYVKESREPCTGVAPMECLQIRGVSDSAWTNLYTNISGFNYTPGYRYKLKIKVTRIKNPPADGSSLKYTLKKVLEKTKIDTPDKPAQGDEWAYIASKRWGLIKMGDSILSQSGIWLEFDPATGRFHGKGGCNSISGGYQSTANNITFTMAISTRMACMDPGVMRRETAFLQLISEHSYKYDVADQTLNLYEDGKIVLMLGMMQKEENK